MHHSEGAPSLRWFKKPLVVFHSTAGEHTPTP
ncbi:hypothetical protein BIW11_03469 [Tropilaelaps mercedesae]|uniref:Uncharacterized protein n=1 Tax=Tropilaelaps mercedesae TaxID=418985 RepID=A0A1V9XKQ0_9ACAR|nr:hypothetical protein BIW11_03469 [Tropilaelaps mercedesae]